MNSHFSLTKGKLNYKKIYKAAGATKEELQKTPAL